VVSRRAACEDLGEDRGERRVAQTDMTGAGDVRLHALWAWSEIVAHTGCWEHVPSTGELLWSDNLYRIFGLDAGTRLSVESVFAAVHPNDRERAAASMARRHEPLLAESYEAAAEIVREAIERELWSEFHGRYLRSIGDPVLDVSLLGLAWPFAAVDPGGERMRATVAALERELGDVEQGVARYAGDTYAGGNNWVLAALWLGLWHRQVGDAGGLERSLEYAVRVQTTLGLLPEQVKENGEPAWVVPLAWSHAMLLLAARPELESISAGKVEMPAAVGLEGS